MEYVWQQVDILARRQELLLSTSNVASYHGSAMSVVMIRYRKSYYKEQWMVVVAEGPRTSCKDNIKKWTDWSMASLQRIGHDKGRWAVIATDASVDVT